MKYRPAGRAGGTDGSASPRSTARNSWPSDDAPKLSTGSVRPVLPRGRRSIAPSSVHANADDEQQVGEPLLVGGLDGQHVVRGSDRLVKVPLLDRLQLQR